jgi:hypothetical protein
MAIVSLKTFLKKGFLEKTVRNSPQVATAVDKIFRRRVIGLKGAALADFDRHVITRELSQGPSGLNISGTLGGVGNLFSFIGFESSTNPVALVRAVLKAHFDVHGVQRKLRGNKGVRGFRYSLSFPVLSSFDSASPMPWETGNSWIKGIEEGISGFSNYMYFTHGEGKAIKEKSRSGTAVQSKREINIGFFKPTKYISEILDKYRKRLD